MLSNWKAAILGGDQATEEYSISVSWDGFCSHEESSISFHLWLSRIFRVAELYSWFPLLKHVPNCLLGRSYYHLYFIWILNFFGPLIESRCTKYRPLICLSCHGITRESITTGHETACLWIVQILLSPWKRDTLHEKGRLGLQGLLTLLQLTNSNNLVLSLVKQVKPSGKMNEWINDLPDIKFAMQTQAFFKKNFCPQFSRHVWLFLAGETAGCSGILYNLKLPAEYRFWLNTKQLDALVLVKKACSLVWMTRGGNFRWPKCRCILENLQVYPHPHPITSHFNHSDYFYL